MNKAAKKTILAMSILYYVLCYISDSLPGGQLLIAFPLTAMMFVYLRSNRGVIKLCAIWYFIYILAFLGFCMLSRLWAEDSRAAVPKINSLLFAMLGMIVIVMCTYSTHDVDILLKTIMYGGYFVCLFIAFRYGWRGILSLVRNDSRISNEVLNANTLGMCASYSVVINVHYFINRKFKLQDLAVLPAILLLLASGSRKAIIIVILGVFGLLLLKNMNNRDILRTVLRIILASVLLVGSLFLLSKLPMFSSVTARFKNLISLLQGNETRSTSSAWIRFAYIELGMELFRSHPWLGIGIANANIYTGRYYGHNHYLHNNFVELLACGGIIGFLIYYSIWMYLLSVFIKCRDHRDRKYNICFVLLILHMAMDYGAVTYYGKGTYVFLFLFWMEAKQLLSERRYRRLNRQALFEESEELTP